MPSDAARPSTPASPRTRGKQLMAVTEETIALEVRGEGCWREGAGREEGGKAMKWGELR